MYMRKRSLLAAFLLGVISLVHTPVTRAWDEDGHAIIAYLACDALPEQMPAWIKTPQIRQRLIYLSSEPDRWRGQHSSVLNHINNPDHYIDEEKLHPFGLTLQSLPLFRRQYVDLLATQRALHPQKLKLTFHGNDQDYTQATPGLLPYRIEEEYWKIASSWTQLRTYEKFPGKVSPSMLRNARQNIVYHMGILSHYVGDGAQPLHLTIHHHGWIGPNPKGYTTDPDIHGMIDAGVLRTGHIYYEMLRTRAKPARTISPHQPWPEICGYLYESFQLVEPLYALEKSGELKTAKGKTFIENRLLTGGAMLAGVWAAAYHGSRIDDFRVQRLKDRYPHQPGRAPQKAGGSNASNP